jgi:hypothetical protein
MPKDDSFYEDHTNRLWARWERELENTLVFYDSEEEDRHEQELQALRDQELSDRVSCHSSRAEGEKGAGARTRETLAVVPPT